LHNAWWGGGVLPLTYAQFKVQHGPTFYARPWDLGLYNNAYVDKNSVPILGSRPSELITFSLAMKTSVQNAMANYL
jgi:hypothetical protein